MREHLLHQLPVLLLLPSAVEHADAPAAAQAIARHLQLVHRVDVLHVELPARAVRRARHPQVQVLVPARLKVEGVVT